MAPPPLAHDAVVLAGGRGSRLGGVDKGGLVVGGRRLLDIALQACQHAHRTVVVGDGPVPQGVRLTREEPRYGGPAAGLAAGLRALGAGSEYVLVLACDLPGAEAGVELLLSRVDEDPDVDGWCLAEADGRLQWLFGVYRRAALDRAIVAQTATRDLSMGRLLRPLTLGAIPAPAVTTADVDTVEDLCRVRAGGGRPA